MTTPAIRRAVTLISVLALALVGGCGSDAGPAESSPPITVSPPAQDPSETATAGDGAGQPAQDPSDTATVDDGAGQPAQEVVLGDRDKHRVVDEASALVHCDGRAEVTVVASGIEVTITGVCDDIDVDGSGSIISVESTEDLDVDGNGNTVTVVTVDEVSVDGNDNVITADEITRELDLDGNGNTVTYATGSPEVDDDGNGNQINP